MPPIIRCDQMVVGTVFRFGGWLLNCLTGKFLPSDDRHDVGCWAHARGTDPLYSRRGEGTGAEFHRVYANSSNGGLP